MSKIDSDIILAKSRARPTRRAADTEGRKFWIHEREHDIGKIEYL